MQIELWKITLQGGKQSRLIATKINDNLTKLTLIVIKPGVKWSKDVLIQTSFENVQAAFKGITEWKQEWYYGPEQHGVYRAVRCIALPAIKFKLYWMVLHIEYLEEGESQFQVQDQFYGCSTIPIK
jgi:hypothetical protein